MRCGCILTRGAFTGPWKRSRNANVIFQWLMKSCYIWIIIFSPHARMIYYIIVWIDLLFASEACDNCRARDSLLSKIRNISAANWNIRRKWIIQISFLLFTCIITPVFITKNYEMFAEMHLPFSSRFQISENRCYIFHEAYIWIN